MNFKDKLQSFHVYSGTGNPKIMSKICSPFCFFPGQSANNNNPDLYLITVDPSNGLVTKYGELVDVEGIGSGASAFDGENADQAAIAEVKAFVEANAVLPGEYPPTCAICTALSQWVTKALAAADASGAHQAFLAEQAAAAAGSVEEEE